MGPKPGRSTLNNVDSGSSLRRRAGAGLLVAPVFFALAMAPWAHTGDPPTKLAFSLCSLLVSISLWRRNWPRRSELQLNPRALQKNSGAQPAPISSLRLTGWRETWSTEGTSEYEVLVRYAGEGAGDLIVSRATRPLLALKPLTTIGALESTRLVSDWGLDRNALFALLKCQKPTLPETLSGAEDPKQAIPQSPFELRADVRPAQKAVALSLLFGSLFVVTVTAVVFTRRLDQHLAINWLSWLMPSVASLLALVFAAVTKFNHCVLHSGGGLTLERRLLGFTLVRYELEPANMLGAWSVSPDGGAPLHLLIATTQGPIETPCCGQGALSILGALRTQLGTAAPS